MEVLIIVRRFAFILILSLLAAGCARPGELPPPPGEQYCTGVGPRPDGSVVTDVHRDYWLSQSVGEVVESAEIILIGRVTRQLDSFNAMRNPNDPRQEALEISPATGYEVQVEQYLRGRGKKVLTVAQDGGTYKGCSEEPTSEPFVVGETYIFFLRKTPVGDRYILSNLPGHWRMEGERVIPAQVLVGESRIGPVGLTELKALIRQK